MANYTELIDKYLNNELSEQERISFEDQLKTNAELKKEFELQLYAIKGVQRAALKKEVSKTITKTKLTKTITKALIATTIAVAVFGTGYYVKKKLLKNETSLKYELNEQGNKNWSEADKVLPSQVFNINPKRDTVIETGGGILFAIEAGTFLNKFGEAETENIEIEIKEALNAYDIMKAGLSTTSNGALLETGGMFYINARKGKDNLEIDQQKPIQTSVPYSGTRDDMMLFDGERKPDGSINWINPIPTAKQLTCTEITKLDFYPPHYIDSLRQWGKNYKNKKYTDSLYYSFTCLNSPATPETSALYDYPVKDSTLNRKLYSVSATDTVKKTRGDGKALFKANCAVCHTTDSRKLTGPGLEGIENRAPKGDWLLRYIKNNDKVKRSGDAYALKLSTDNNFAAMTVFEGSLSDADINTIIGYITNGKGGIIVPNEENGNCSIDPSIIHSIWDKKFNNTILATREFEQRLKVIFKTCNNNILNLYIQNLNKDLFVLDSTAATMCSGEERLKFIDFYKRHDGGVRIDNKQMSNLLKHAREKRNVQIKAAEDALNKISKENEELYNKFLNASNNHAEEEFIRTNTNFKEEFEINVKEAYRQVGKEYKSQVSMSDNNVSAPITRLGWKNLDAYVIESTSSRTTLNYIDPDNGKKAVIKYEPLKLHINDVNKYDKVVAYLIPNKLSSFQLMKQGKDDITENLNELMEYDLMVIGFKDAKTFIYEAKNIKPGNTSISLTEIKQNVLEQKINTQFGPKHNTGLLRDYNYHVLELKETIRQKKEYEKGLFRIKVMEVIFPCYRFVSEAYQ